MATKPIKKRFINRLVKSRVMLLDYYKYKKRNCLKIAIDDIIKLGYIPLKLHLEETETDGQGLVWRISSRVIYVGKNKARIWKYCNGLIKYYEKNKNF